MAHYFVYPEKDTFLSNARIFLTNNFGHDAILEIEKVSELNPTDSRFVPYYTRALIKFDISDISESIVNGDIVNPKFDLNLKVIEAKEIPLEYTIEIHPISQSWEMGVGRKFDKLTNGASWKFRDVLNGLEWMSGSLTDKTGGGTWYSGSTVKIVNSFSSNSIGITSLNLDDSFYITGSDGTPYTFRISSSFSSSNSAYSSASINITSINENDKFIITGSISAKLFADDTPLPPDITGSNVYYFHGSGSSQALEATSEINILSISDGDIFEIHGGRDIKLIASENPIPMDVEEANLFFFQGADMQTSSSYLPDSVLSMSIKINNIDGLNISSSVASGTLLQLTSSNGVGDEANNYTFTVSATGNSASFSGGEPSSLKSLMYKINSISNLNITASISSSNLILSSSLIGNIGNSFSFTSGSTVTNLFGQKTVLTPVPLVDDLIGNIFYFDTGSSLSSSVENLKNKIDQTISFLSVKSNGNILQFTSSVIGPIGNLIGLQSGSFQETLQGGVFSSSVSISSSKKFVFEESDIKLDVTNIVTSWLNGTIPNEGFILKHSDAEEADNKNYGKLRFYSMDTNTIYSPYIDVQWIDSNFFTGSLTPIISEDKVVYVKNLQEQYKAGSLVRMEVFSREKFPIKTFNRTSDYLHMEYLPETTYYSVKDGESEETIIDFSDFTKVSCDENGNYFMLDTNGLGQERFFKIIIKVVENGTTEYFDNNSLFKITR